MAYSVTTRVLAPANSYDLTDLASIKIELMLKASATPDDAWLSQAITQVSKSIANHCNRTFAVEVVQDAFDIQQDPYPYQTPGGFSSLSLSRWPVISLTSVAQTLAGGANPITQTMVEGTDFRLDAESGQLLRLNPAPGTVTNWESLPVTVTYQTGYDAIPADLVEACHRLITNRYRSRGRDPMLTQRETPGVGIERWWFGPAPGQKGAFPPEIDAILDNYRVPVVL